MPAWLRLLSARLGAGLGRQTHLPEHSLEVQLPFLRCALSGASLVPVLTGGLDAAQARDLGRALAELARNRPVLLAASTDTCRTSIRACGRGVWTKWWWRALRSWTPRGSWPGWSWRWPA